jgi:hypothetical protein
VADGSSYILPDRTDGRLGRHCHHDPQNRSFPIRALVGSPVLRTRVWSRFIPAFDQGYTSSCTAQAAAGLLSHPPFTRPEFSLYDQEPEREELYRSAQMVDPYPDTPPQGGSSTDAPFRVLRDRGHIREWRWCFGVNDVLATLSGYGPVAVGTVWTEGMFEPDRNGIISDGGSVAGGHAYELLGIDTGNQTVIGMNSWGNHWAVEGTFRMTWEMLDRLLQRDGEAVTVVL